MQCLGAIDSAPFNSIPTETGEWLNMPVDSEPPWHASIRPNTRAIFATFGTAAALQLALGAYRASLLVSSLLPAVAFALAIASIGFIWWLGEREMPGQVIVRPVGIVALIIAILAMIAMMTGSFLDLAACAAAALLLGSIGMILVARRAPFRVLLFVLALFVLGFSVLEWALTRDARWHAQNRTRDIHATWR
jgi:hypothetical protein